MEREEVGGAGDAPAGAGREHRRGRPLPLWLVDELKVALIVAAVQAGHAINAPLGDLEARVAHAERAKDAAGEVVAEGASAGPLHEHSEDVVGRVVGEALARLVDQRKAAECGHPSVRRRERVGPGRPLVVVLDQLRGDRRREVRWQTVPTGRPQEVGRRDRTRGRDGVVELGGRLAQDRWRGQLG